MTQIKHVLRIASDPSKSPQAFVAELNRILATVSDSFDAIYGHRGQPTFWSDIDMQSKNVRFNDTPSLRRNETTKQLEAYDGTRGIWVPWLTDASIFAPTVIDEDPDTYLTADETHTTYVVTSSGTSNLYLPEASEDNLNKSIEVHRVKGAGGVIINADDDDVINDSTEGGNISSKVASQTSSIRLRVIRKGRWGLSAVIGTWRTDA